jgi:hypothetical protein
MYSSDNSREPNCFAEFDGLTLIDDSGSKCDTAYEIDATESAECSIRWVLIFREKLCQIVFVSIMIIVTFI